MDANRPVEQSQDRFEYEAIDIHDRRWMPLHKRFVREKQHTGSSIRAVMILQQAIENETLAVGLLPFDPAALGYLRAGSTSLKTPPPPASAFRIPSAVARDWFRIELSNRGNHDDGTFEDSAALKWQPGAKRFPWPVEVLVADAADLMPEPEPQPEPVETAPTEAVKPEPADDTPTPPELLEELSVELTPQSAETAPIEVVKPADDTPTSPAETAAGSRRKQQRLRPGPQPLSPVPLWQILRDNPSLMHWQTDKRREELRDRYHTETGHWVSGDKIDDWIRAFRREDPEKIDELIRAFRREGSEK